MLRWTMFNPFPSWRSLSWTNSGRSEFHRPLWTWSCWNSSSLAHPGRHWRSGTLRGLNHVGKKWELQIWVQLISIDPLVDLVVEHGNGKLLTFSGENHPKKRVISPPSDLQSPSISQVKMKSQPQEPSKLSPNQTSYVRSQDEPIHTAQKKASGSWYWNGIDGVFCRTNLNIEISQQYPKSAPTFTAHLISWMEDPQKRNIR